jgi:AraC-like DNA-binding protein
MDVVDLRKHDGLEYDYCCEKTPDRQGFYMHMHDKMEIYYLIRGDVEYHVENQVYLPKAGDIMIMRAGELHASQLDANYKAPYERYNLRFSPELLQETLNSRLLQPFLNRPTGECNLYRADEIPSQYVRSCLERMFARKNEHRERVMSYLIPILQEIYDVWITREISKEKCHDSLASEIISYINHNLSTLRSPQELTEKFYLSNSQIYREFRAYTGTSIWNYVRTKRLIAAREQMQNGEHPAQAAALCGFEDYSTFYRAYKRQFGCNPLVDFRKNPGGTE